MKIMVAGGAGYIGSVLIPILQEHGYEVDVYDELWFGNQLPDGTPVKQVDLFKVSDQDLSGYDQVIFLAGLSNDPMAEHDPAMNFIQNGALPSYLAFRAKQAGVRRFVYASSCSVYGYTVNELYDEDAPVSCSYPYGISKLEGERGVLSHANDNFSTIALRQGTVNGYSPRMRFDLIINTMYKCALLDGVITVNNPGIWRPLIDVRDTSAAFLRAVQADYSISGVYNVAYDNFTVGQVADLVKEEVEALTGKKVRVDLHDRQDFRNYKVTTERARTTLGFAPKYGVTDTIRDLHAHHAEYGDLDQDRFYNIRVFKQMQG
jgi:nucleoside-diphosphate-sugar epimerase